MRSYLLFAATGWAVGLLFTVLFALLVFPITFGTGRLSDRSDLLTLATILLIVSPPALLGGLFGGRLVREGGRSSQVVMAALVALFFAVPVGCLSLWYLGW